MNKQPDQQKFKKELADYFMLVTRIGLVMAGSILFFFFIGLFVEKKFQLKGVFLIFMIIAGIICGFYYIYFSLKKMLMLNNENTKK
ncbi:AtpZ/AtpI family protein [Candidatus Margulisiibacteriota bacterium]